jgi:hypothetical protein
MTFYFEDIHIDSHWIYKYDVVDNNDGFLSFHIINPYIKMQIGNVSYENVLKMCTMTKTRPVRELIGWLISQKIDVQEIVNSNEVTINNLTFKWKNEPTQEERRFWYLRLKYHCYWYDINAKFDLIYNPDFKWKDADPGFIELNDVVVENVD